MLQYALRYLEHDSLMKAVDDRSNSGTQVKLKKPSSTVVFSTSDSQGTSIGVLFFLHFLIFKTMKTQTKRGSTTQAKTQFVAITNDVQLVNQEVEKAYTLMVDKAIDLLKKFEVSKFRTYAMMEHTKNEQNTNLVREFLSYFHNITLSMNPKDGKYYIFIDLGQEALEKFGSNLTNQLLRLAYETTHSNDNTIGIEYALRVTFLPSDQHHNFFYRRVAEGETGYVSISTVEKEAA